MKDGKLCESLDSDPTFKPTEILDLNKAMVKRTDLDGGDEYSVSGDQKTCVSDEMIKNEVDVARLEATLSITALQGSLSLNFASDRDNNPRSDLYISPGKNIEVDASDSSEAKFQYVDGSAVTFDDDDDDSGDASSTGASSAPTTTTTTTG
ncbi:hypothetical protein FQN54_004783 [Arachnomyces sp. PD_36]|nr:hypothetical protein FQN54_004783 [Arachnomyces sp. PD_36]